MKTITVKDHGKFKARDVIRGAVGQAVSGMNLTQMRNRIRVLDALDKLKEGETSLKLEDADFEALKEAMENQPWAVADRDLLAVIDGVMSPK